MKTTKNQAEAVRSYLATLGHNISHVQALEVIARGAGQRSRHVAPHGAPVRMPVTPLMTAETALKLHYGEEGEHPLFQRSDWMTTKGYPTYWAWLSTKVRDIGNLELEGVTGSAEHISDFALSEQIKADYWVSGHDASDLASAELRLMNECGWLFENPEAACTFLLEAPSLKQLSGMAAATIKATYLASPRASTNVALALAQLKTMCQTLFGTPLMRRKFLMDEAHVDSRTIFGIQTDSEVFGVETHYYGTQQGRQDGLFRLMSRAVQYENGVLLGAGGTEGIISSRAYYFFEIEVQRENDEDSTEIEVESEKYTQALSVRNEAASIGAIGALVLVDSESLGTVQELAKNIEPLRDILGAF
jgi:hypothetical protein